MFNRLDALIYIEHLFKNIKKLDYKEMYKYIRDAKGSKFPDNITEEMERVYYRILLNEDNKDIPIINQIDIVLEFYTNLKKYIKQNNLDIGNVNVKISLMDFEFTVIVDYLKSRNFVRTIRKGYK